jgi:hypothetical protein
MAGVRLCLVRPLRLEYRRGHAIVHWLAQSDDYHDSGRSVVRGAGWDVAREQNCMPQAADQGTLVQVPHPVL